MCVCPRIDDKWSEKDIFYVENAQKDLYDTLEDKKLHVIFVNYEKDDQGGFWIKPGNQPFFVKSDNVTSEDLYHQGKFFSTIETAYNDIYNKPKA